MCVDDLDPRQRRPRTSSPGAVFSPPLAALLRICFSTCRVAAASNYKELLVAAVKFFRLSSSLQGNLTVNSFVNLDVSLAQGREGKLVNHQPVLVYVPSSSWGIG